MLRAFKSSLPGAGASELITVTHGNAASIYCRDPEGNRLEIFVDLPWYVAQPLREPIDLDIDDGQLFKMLEAHARSLAGFEPRAAWRQRMARLMGLTDADPTVT
jgi:catechol-2,3-dioxygenase